MQDYKKDFIEFIIDSKALKFGDFVTKSGRNTPFFINAGSFSTGEQLDKLGNFYARCIMDNFKEEIEAGVDVIFGPAYKGIPLSVITACALYRDYGINIRYASDRKEEKDHGEGGKLLGGPITSGDTVIIIEDVTTAGTSIRQTFPIITREEGVRVAGLVIAVDRMEKGTGDVSALTQIGDEYQIKTASIVNMSEVTEYLYNRDYKGKVVIDDELKSRIDDYYDRYGV